MVSSKPATLIFGLRVTGIALAAMLSFASTRAVAQTGDGPFMCTSTATGNLNLRAAPGLDAPVVGALASGVAVDGVQIDDTGEWMQIVSGEGLSAWAAVAYLECHAVGQPTSTASHVPTRVAPTPTPTTTQLPATAAPTVTPTDVPTPTTAPSGEVCVWTFGDANTNGVRDDGDGEQVSASFGMDGAVYEGCASFVPGQRRLRAILEDGLRATLGDVWNINVRAGERVEVLIGVSPPDAQPESYVEAETNAFTAAIGIVSAGLFVTGVAAAVVAKKRRTGARRSWEG